MDRILSAGENTKRIRRAGRMDKAKAEADDLETMEKRNDPI
jgi:hypothetical protein